MSIKFIPLTKKGKQHREPLRKKKCAFPGCKKSQRMTARARYCTEHRKRKYRKIIDAGKAKKKQRDEEIRSVNQIIRHDNSCDNNTIVMKCGVTGCNNMFEIKLIKDVIVYPKYCESHRNFWKREFFLKQNMEKF